MLNQKIYKHKLSQIYSDIYAIFIFCTIFILESQIIPNSFSSKIYASLEILFIFITLAFLLIFNLLNKYFKDIILASILFLVSMIPIILFRVQIISPFILILYLLTLVCSKFIDPIMLIKKDFFARLFSILIIFITYIFHLVPVNSVVRNGIVRYSLGFTNPNICSLVNLSLIMSLILYLNYCALKIHRLLILLIFLIVYLIILLLTKSEECEVGICILLLLLGISKLRYLRRAIIEIPIFSVIASSLFSLCIVFYFNSYSGWFYKLDNLLDHRLYGFILSFNILHVRLFGYLNTSVIGSYNNLYTYRLGTSFISGTLDNSFLFALMKLGIVGFCGLIMYLLISGILLSKSRNYLLCSSFITIMIIFFSAQCMELYFLIPVFVSLGRYIFKYKLMN